MQRWRTSAVPFSHIRATNTCPETRNRQAGHAQANLICPRHVDEHVWPAMQQTVWGLVGKVCSWTENVLVSDGTTGWSKKKSSSFQLSMCTKAWCWLVQVARDKGKMPVVSKVYAWWDRERQCRRDRETNKELERVKKWESPQAEPTTVLVAGHCAKAGHILRLKQ